MLANIVGRNEEDHEEGRRMQAEKEVKEKDKKEEKMVAPKRKEEKMLHPRKEVVFSSLPFAHALTIQVHLTSSPWKN